MSPEPSRAGLDKSGEYAEDHFRMAHGLKLSSIGLGTRLGAADDVTDGQYTEAILAALVQGCNVLDTSPNYRGGRSERVIGRALQKLQHSGAREDVVVCTKGGLVSPDSPGELTKLAKTRPAEELVDGRHCLRPDFLEISIDWSRKNLDVDTIDVYYLDQVEIQLEAVSRSELEGRLAAAFETLQKAMDRGWIRCFGISSPGLLAEPQQKNHLSLERLKAIARKAGGERDGLRFVQAPYSLARPEAMTGRNQTISGESFCLIQASADLGMAFVAAESLGAGRAIQQVPRWLSGILSKSATPAQEALQFARSTPEVTTALVGMSRADHVAENLALAKTPPVEQARFEKLYPPEAAQAPWLF